MMERVKGGERGRERDGEPREKEAMKEGMIYAFLGAHHRLGVEVKVAKPRQLTLLKVRDDPAVHGVAAASVLLGHGRRGGLLGRSRVRLNAPDRREVLVREGADVIGDGGGCCVVVRLVGQTVTQFGRPAANRQRDGERCDDGECHAVAYGRR